MNKNPSSKLIKLNILAEKYWKKIQKKYIFSITWFVFLKISIFALTAVLIILNLYAIKFNDDYSSKLFFVIIAVLSGFSGLLASVISFFNFKKKIIDNSKKIRKIKHEFKQWQKKENEYSTSDRDFILINKILETKNRNEK